MTLWKRKLNIYPRFFLRPVCLLIRFFQLNDFRCGITKYQDRDVLNLLDDTECSIDFTKKEIQKGYECLNNFGLNKNSKFVCLIVRDNEYLKNIYQQTQNTITSRHQYRNSDINNYLEACEYLTTQGYFVFRMGVKASEQFNTNNPMIIDYAFSSKRSAFLDIFLGSRCEFCISTATGFDAIPVIFRKPVLFINYLPVGDFFTFSKKFMLTTKLHYSKKLKKNIFLKEIFDNKVGFSVHSNIFTTNNVDLIQMTSVEILNAVKDMLKYINNNFNLNNFDNEKQIDFWRVYNNNLIKYNESESHGKLKAKIAPSFLKNIYESLN